ncbi:hypothetical protein K469DRAFT_675476 [Zopfia rhizophila CBS 207.26]|uniref:Uncharacterized protein n=1 Tax=Zopfia rhizophila CBS 207.26 TaxID=1314779 RepID=A0A6A6DKW6_9PEZI|nr:hypothetical protein K469DRAFT_675476 [Zopfia rhizophila CBS 207.26]
MRYVRFLKTPRIIDGPNPSKAHVYCLVTITSDLGDSFFPYDVQLSAELCSTDSKCFVHNKVKWSGGMRSLPVILSLAPSSVEWPARVRVGVQPNSQSDQWDKLYSPDHFSIVSAWSAPLDPPRGVKEAAKLIERQLCPSSRKTVQIWEETGESIARHLWDAGITLSSHLDALVTVPTKSMPLGEVLWPTEGGKRLQVLELGTGCGIVGISLAQAIENIDVILSDLPETEEIVNLNMHRAALARGSTVKFQTLDWDNQLPDRSNNCPHYVQFDLIIAADCTYNPDSSPALVQTMSKLVTLSPNASIIVAMKVRHSGEEVFFGLMSDAGFKVEGTTSLPLPGDDELGEKSVEIFLFRASIKGQPTQACSNRVVR